MGRFKTEDFKGEIDYEEGNSIKPEDKKDERGPVYFGVRNRKNPGRDSIKKCRILNRELKENEVLTTYYKDLEKSEKNSRYYGRVFYPERRDDGDGKEIWTYKKNRAFWAGAIDAKKEFVLVTPIEHYQDGFISGTVSEILWLHDNGYSFGPVKNNPFKTGIIPPERAKTNSFVKNYEKIIQLGPNNEEILANRLKAIIERVIEARNQMISARDSVSSSSSSADSSYRFSLFSSNSTVDREDNKEGSILKKRTRDESEFIDGSLFDSASDSMEPENKKQKTNQSDIENEENKEFRGLSGPSTS